MARHQMYYAASAKKNIAASLKIHRKTKFAASLANRRKAVKCAMTEDETDDFMEALESAEEYLDAASGDLDIAAGYKSNRRGDVQKALDDCQDLHRRVMDLLYEFESDDEMGIEASSVSRQRSI